MKTPVSIGLWFDHQAKEAMTFYTSLFGNSKIINENPVAVTASLHGVHFTGINGGPAFTPNPSISFMVICETKEEIDELWKAFISGGRELMALQEYPWSAYYGWIEDKYGFSWQLYQGKLSEVNHQKIVPTLMFGQVQQGRCEEAIHFYQKVFADFRLEGILNYTDGPVKGQVMHSQYVIKHFTFMAMDSGVAQDSTFNEAISYILYCKNQEEIDYYWNAFTKEGKESKCGWCVDPFGVSWQIIPENIEELLARPNAMKALMQMKKIEITVLQNA